MWCYELALFSNTIVTQVYCVNSFIITMYMNYWAQKIPLNRQFIILIHNKHLTHWGRVAHMWVSKIDVIVLDHGLSPGQHQIIIWINAGMLSIRPSRRNFNEMLIEIYTFLFKTMHLKNLVCQKDDHFVSVSIC